MSVCLRYFCCTLVVMVGFMTDDMVLLSNSIEGSHIDVEA